MKKLIFPIVLALAVSCTASILRPENGDYDFNDGWKFCICDSTANLSIPVNVFDASEKMEIPYGCALPNEEDGPSLLALSLGPKDSPELAEPDFDDSEWRVLDLPHDWAIEGDFNRNNPSGIDGGALTGGIGWYRKSFFVPRGIVNKQVRLEFDGVYMNSTVWLNGHELGTRPYGYISFSYNLTPHLIPGQSNTIAVRVDNSDQPNSRWYSGCGIFRNVRISVRDSVHIAQWGVFAETASEDEMQVSVCLEKNNDTDSKDIEIKNNLIDREGKVVASSSSAPDSSFQCRSSLLLVNPIKWSPAQPYLYDLETKVLIRGKEVDCRHTPVGIRTIVFSPEQGMILNGELIKINGVCLHHDLGCLGSAVNKSALRRQLSILKEMGANAVRCSHNPPSLELLDLCDEMGLMVMDEAFDMWRQRKTERDYARFFEQWHKRDLEDLVLRDRYHPCIIMWSIGNEVLEQWGNDADAPSNAAITAELTDIVHRLDPTRPVTSGCNEPSPENHLFRSGVLDVIGYNYHDSWFASVPENFPGKPFVVSESVSSLMTRGCYRIPSDSVRICPPRWEDPHIDPTFECSAYDNCHVPWGCTHEKNLYAVENNDFIIGQFIWTGFDYLGEPIPFGWPARSSYFGIVDLAGFPKDIYYMYQSVWRTDLEILHLFPHWNWNEGDIIDVWAYFNNADSVELFLNGVSCGLRHKGDSSYHCSWRIPYSPGELKAISYKEGRKVCECVRKTAGEPAFLRLTADRDTICSDGRDLSFITVEVVDENGNLCPHADNDIHFSLKGPGTIAGVDNGSPISLERFKANHRRAYKGKCLLVVRNNGKAGRIVVSASSQALSGKCIIAAN